MLNDKAKTKPAGVKVSKSMLLQLTGPERSQAIHALRMIDRVNGDGELPLTQIVKGPIYSMWEMEYDPAENSMTANTGKIADMEFKIIHEVGHMLDYQIFGSGKGYGSERGIIEMQGWREAVLASNAYKNLKDIFDHGFLVGAQSDYVAEFMMERELFSRSYVQYIAQRSENGVLLHQLDCILKRDVNRLISTQWTKDDFMLISKEIDKLFGSKYWTL